MDNKETARLSHSNNNKNWKKWGPYLSERQWGTVREDYSPDGNAWNFVNHDLARSYSYRWGEEGIAGFCDADQVLCLAPAFWNGKDPILKERLFGLTNEEGNHGEDVKELYFHLDSSPTHSYCKFLYKYPQAAFPYLELLQKNRKDRLSPEYELLDTGIFKDDRYFDCYIEYAKAEINDILVKITICNRAPEPATIHVLPHLWFRNFWKHNPRFSRPEIVSVSTNCLQASSLRNGEFFFYHQGGEQLFCENETNNQRMYSRPNDFPYVKDGINNYIVNKQNTINPEKRGTKAAIWLKERIKPGASKTFKIRLCKHQLEDPWMEFDEVFALRQAETHDYYDQLAPKSLPPANKALLRSAVSGLLWTKQFYYLDVFKWLFGEPNENQPNRNQKRNYHWQHLTSRNIISMPDKWEYPWFAAWDLAFHAATFVHIDPDFAKQQLSVILREYYMHPNGQIPAYEWNFSDVNPPVHAWSVWYVYEADKKKTGVPDWDFLERAFQKLLMNFAWWDDQDRFYYDAIQFENGTSQRLKIRSLVGIIPLLAVEIIHGNVFRNLRQFNTRLEVIRLIRPDLTRIISDIENKNKDGNYLFAIMVGDRLEHLLKRLLDEAEFLSDYGIRSLSKCYQDNPYVFGYKGNNYEIHYEPGESSSDMFGGNSNWRGPIWLPLNYLIIHSLRKYYKYYGDTYTYEFPAGSGNKLNLRQIANELTKRLLNIFERDDTGKFQYHPGRHQCWSKEHFQEHHLFYEFFHGDTGQGLGASHQTGWTALLANL